MLPMPSVDLIERRGGAGPRYTSYPAATEWTNAVGPDVVETALARASVDDPVSLYVHIPFCVEMCRFCGCNVIATRDQTRADDYLDVLEREVALWKARLPGRMRVSQLHLGGGTPTFLSVPQLDRLISLLKSEFAFEADAQLAIEVDPDVTTLEQIAFLGQAGFTRLSAGVQDLNPAVQAAIGRIQSAEKTEAIIRAARKAGFKSINIDLMYGLPFQTPETFSETIARVLAMQPDRLALFGYAHVPWVKPQQRLLPQAHLPGPAQRVELFVKAADQLEAAGFEQVGLDHFARKEDDLAKAVRAGTLTRNFQGYSTDRASDTLAFGLSAISDIGGVFLQNAHRYNEWESKVRAGELPFERCLVRSGDDELRGGAIQSVMCSFRLDLQDLHRRFGASAERVLSEAEPSLASCQADGLISRSADAIEVLPLGRLFLRNIAMSFDAYLGRRAPDAKAFSRTI